MRFFTGLVALAIALALAAPARAQQITTGTINGTVRDAQGLALPGVIVELTNEQTSNVRQVISNEVGAFTFAAVPLGRYTLTLSLDGFRAIEHSGIQLRSNEAYNAGVLTLEVGAITDVVNVVAERGVVQTGSTEGSAVLEAEQLDSLIARGRDPMSLMRAMPGAVVNLRDESLGRQNCADNPQFSGLPEYATGVNLDGMNTNDQDTSRPCSTVNMDSIEEIRVVLNNYQAEFGRSAGAQVNIISKSGSRNFAGSFSYYKRDEALNANNFFNNLNNLPKPAYRYDTFTATLGGPVFVPRVLEQRDRLFFFYSREMWNVHEPLAIQFRTMPTALERQGDFSQTFDLNGRLMVIRDPLSGQPFPGNRIPAHRINEFGQAMLHIFPTPNFLDPSITGGNYNYRDQAISDQTKTMNQLKVDYNASQNDRLTVRVRNFVPLYESYRSVFSVDSNWNHFRNSYRKSEKSLQLTHSRTFGSAIVNELSVSGRLLAEVTPPIDPDRGFHDITRAALGLAPMPQLFPEANPADIFPELTFGGIPSAPNTSLESRFPMNAGDDRYTIANNLSWARGRHLFKAGLYYEWNYNDEGVSGACFTGCFNFSVDRNNPGDTGHPFANALLGNYRDHSQSSRRNFRGAVSGLWEWFVQDSWRAHPRLAFDMGLRFTRTTPWQLATGKEFRGDIRFRGPMVGAAFVADRFDPGNQPRLFRPAIINGQRVGHDAQTGQIVPAPLIGAMVPDSGDFFNGMVTHEDPLVNRSWRTTPPIQVQPRLGFVWDPTGRGKTSILGGYGITVQAYSYSSGEFANRVPMGPPFRLQPVSWYGNIADLDRGQAFLFPFATVHGYEHDWRPARVHNFSLTVQQDIGFSTILKVGYVGNRADNLTQQRNLNVVPPGARFDSINEDPTNPGRALPDLFLRPITGYGNIIVLNDEGYSDYDSLQLSANRRYKDRIAFGVNYTLSRARNLSDGIATLPTYEDTREWLYDYSGNDRSHVVSLNAVWDLPRASAKWNNLLSRAVLDNWQVAVVGTLATGTPQAVTFTTTDNADITGGGDGSRLVITRDPNLPRGERTFERWFDTSVFARPAQGDSGYSGRYAFRMPGVQVWDVTLSKDLLRMRARSLQFRTEFYNFLNKVNWTGVNTVARFDPQGNQVNPNFGRMTAAGDPRVIQLSLRFMF